MDLLPLDIIRHIETYLIKKNHIQKNKYLCLKLLIYRVKHQEQHKINFRNLRLNAVNMAFDREYENVMVHNYYDKLNLPDAWHMLKILKRCPCTSLFCPCRRTRTLIIRAINNN